MTAQETLKIINATIVPPNSHAGRPLAVFDTYLNPAMFSSGTHDIVITLFADGELLFEVADRNLLSGWCRHTTEAKLGYTYAEILTYAGDDGATVMTIVGCDGVSIIIGPAADRQLIAIRAFLMVTTQADPQHIGLKLLAMKTRRKFIKLVTGQMAPCRKATRQLPRDTDVTAQLADILSRLSTK